MERFNAQAQAAVKKELQTIWAAHQRVGLDGFMCLYTMNNQDIWRAQQAGQSFWFGPQEVDAAVEYLRRHYNDGNLPNSPMLLCPIVHKKQEGGDKPEPIGSGLAWSMSLCLGIAEFSPEGEQRMRMAGALTGRLTRGDNKSAGLKIIAFADRILKPADDTAVEGCKELYEVSGFQSQEFYPFYLLSGIEYLSKNGLFCHPNFMQMEYQGKKLNPDALPADVIAHATTIKTLQDADTCWHAYDRHHSLFMRFGIDAEHLEENLKYYNLVGRDFRLLDHTGAKHVDADTSASFDFLVDGWLPRGAVTVIGATGGTGKSSLAHNLAVKCAIDYKPGEPNPTWLGSKINLDKCKGICVYFSGEDGPAIVHARAKVYDPEGRAKRLMFQRTDFGEGGTIASFLKELYKLPDVPLVVIDPARKYLTGDENDAGVVSEFFEAIEEFAIRKNAAMVVVHHLVKGARPNHVADIYDMLRGSQVFIDRPRVVIGMYREGGHTIAGLSKNNIPPQLGMVQGERVYRRDGDRLEQVLIGARGLDAAVEDEDSPIAAEKGFIPLEQLIEMGVVAQQPPLVPPINTAAPSQPLLQPTAQPAPQPVKAAEAPTTVVPQPLAPVAAPAPASIQPPVIPVAVTPATPPPAAAPVVLSAAPVAVQPPTAKPAPVRPMPRPGLARPPVRPIRPVVAPAQKPLETKPANGDKQG
jgi:hypothetical protein